MLQILSRSVSAILLDLYSWTSLSIEDVCFFYGASNRVRAGRSLLDVFGWRISKTHSPGCSSMRGIHKNNFSMSCISFHVLTWHFPSKSLKLSLNYASSDMLNTEQAPIIDSQSISRGETCSSTLMPTMQIL